MWSSPISGCRTLTGFSSSIASGAIGGPRVRAVPAAALTAYARSEDRMKALAAGFQIHLAKPIDPAELVTTIASLAKRLQVPRILTSRMWRRPDRDAARTTHYQPSRARHHVTTERWISLGFALNSRFPSLSACSRSNI